MAETKQELTEVEGRSPFKEEFDQWMHQQSRGQLANLYDIFEKHKDALNKSALVFLSSNKIDEARWERAKAEDMSKIVKLIKERIKECAEEANKRR